MATPSTITMSKGLFTGKWVIDKRFSPSPEPGLKVQGITWVLRKAVALAVVTLHISISSPSASHLSNTTGSQLPLQEELYLAVLQVPTAGLAPIPETRILDWDRRAPLRDFLFGARQSRNRFVPGKRGLSGRIVPDVVPETAINDELIGQMLRGEILPGQEHGSGFLVEGDGEGAENPGLWIHSFDSREDGTWTVEQVWGFELVGGERYHTRRFVVANRDGVFEMGRIVFSYLGPL
ncbi:uncharacterized protein N7498_009238 [Penicillium cinerascens]|uniref:Uncharacterized protein n=1 Tax=Penicillium cinerascens TaxID=70096 RepID=A0A9W9M651_9EURO|nr:uncharacterized protein N7498_009238 [Penicillium cinerascens]KAJ5190253.1 hypothetical protein N7498_009238 [Penicillium cinerascens]